MAKLLKFYHRWREFITIAGYLVMLGTIIGVLYQGFCFIETGNANAESVAELQTWKAQTNVNLAVMQQEQHETHENVKQIYKYLLGDKK